LPKHPDEINEETIDIGIGSAVGEIGKTQKVHGRRGRQRDLGGNAGDGAQKNEFIERERMRAPNRRRRVGRGEMKLVAVVIAEFEQRRADLQALGSLHEPAPIGPAAKLPVGRDFESDLFLHAHGGADALVLNARELVVSDLVAGTAPERLA
jgi:hypothetical protein